MTGGIACKCREVLVSRKTAPAEFARPEASLPWVQEDVSKVMAADLFPMADGLPSFRPSSSGTTLSSKMTCAIRDQDSRPWRA